MESEHGGFFRVALNVNIQGAHSIGFNMEFGVGLIDVILKHERILDEPISIEGIFEGWVALIALFNDEVNESWVVDI